jgi:hypothetical protein
MTRFLSCLVFLTFVVFSTGLFFCTPTGSPEQGISIEKLVPENAIAYIQIKDLDALFTNVENFTEPMAGLKNFIPPGMSLKDMASSSIAMMGKISNLYWIDYSSTAGAAIVGPEGDNQEPIVYLMIPALDDEEYKEILKTKKDVLSLDDAAIEEQGKIEYVLNQLRALPSVEGTTQEFKQVKNYIVASNHPEGLTKYPPTKTLDISSLDQYEKGSLTFYYNNGAVLNQYGSTLDSLSSLARMGMQSQDEITKQQTELGVQVIDKIVDMVKQLLETNVGITLNEAGVKIASETQFEAGKSVSQFCSKFEPAIGTKEFLKYLPADYLVNMVCNANPSAFEELIGWYGDVLHLFVQDEAVVNELKSIFNESLKLFGKRFAMGMDISMDIASIQAMDDLQSKDNPPSPEMMEQFMNYFKVGVVGAIEITDYAKYMEFAESMLTNEALKKLIATTYHPMGMDLSFSLEEQTEGDFTYHQMLFNIEIIEPTEDQPDMMNIDPEDIPAVQELLGALLQKFGVYFHHKDGIMYMIMDTQGDPIAILKEMVETNQYPGLTLANSPYMESHLRNLPDDCHMIGNLSINRVFSILSQIPDLGVPHLNLEGAPGLIGSLTVGDNTLNTACYISLKEIKDIFKAFGLG